MKLSNTNPLTLRLAPYDRVTIVLVGCGGTGSHLATGLAAIVLELTARGTPCGLTLVDPDRVERKNIGRQLFGPADIGRNKADVLAERLRLAYRIPAGAIPERFSAGLISDTPAGIVVIVGAVDNPAARAEIAAAVERGRGRVWVIDSGNENHSGQVLIGNCADKNAFHDCAPLGLLDSLPSPYLVMPDLVKAPKHKPRQSQSCADLTESGEQGLMVNRMMAAWTLSILNDFLLGQLRYFGVCVDLKFGGLKSYPIDRTTLAEVSGAKQSKA